MKALKFLLFLTTLFLSINSFSQLPSRCMDYGVNISSVHDMYIDAFRNKMEFMARDEYNEERIQVPTLEEFYPANGKYWLWDRNWDGINNGDDDNRIFYYDLMVDQGKTLPSGYPTEMPLTILKYPDNAPININYVRSHYYMPDNSPVSGWILRWKGEGRIRIRGTSFTSITKGTNVSSDTYTSIDGGRAIVDYTWYVHGHDIEIHESSASNPIRDIELIYPGMEDEFDNGAIFLPEYIEKYSTFKVLRWMDFMNGNNIEARTLMPEHNPFYEMVWEPLRWEERGLVDYYRANRGTGGPHEYIIEFSNLTQTNPWVNIPYCAGEEYVDSMIALYMRDLDPDLTLYVELGNELWNFGQGFMGFHWVTEKSERLFPGAYLGKYITLIQKWVTEAAGSKNIDRIYRVMGIWPRYDDVNNKWLSHAETEYVDALATTWYFSLDKSDRSDNVCEDPATDLNWRSVLYDWYLANPGDQVGFNAKYKECVLNEWRCKAGGTGWSSDAQTAGYWDKEIITYEGGNHSISGCDNGPTGQSLSGELDFDTPTYPEYITDNEFVYRMIEADLYSEESGEIYDEILDTLQSYGYKTVCHFGFAGGASCYGSWSLFDSKDMAEPISTLLATYPKLRVFYERQITNNCDGDIIPEANSIGPGLSIKLDGVDDYLEGQTSFIPDESSNYTSEAWFMSTAEDEDMTILSFSNTGSGNNYNKVFVRGNDNSIVWQIGNNTSFDAKLVGTLIERDKWYHVAAVKSANRYTLYLNGTNVASANYTLGTSSRSEYTIGGVYVTGAVSENFKGEIDEVRLWNIARTQNDIRDFMCKKVKSSDLQFANMESYYRFDVPDYINELVYDNATGSTTGTTQNIRFKERSSYTISGAPIGDISRFVYSSTWTGIGVSINHPDGDMAAVFNIGSGNPEGVHVYFTNFGAFHNYAPLYYEGVTDNKYFGVFMAGGTDPKYDLSYIYSGNPQAKTGTDENQQRLLKKADAADDNWVHSGAKLDLINKSLSVFCKEKSRGEYTLAFRQSTSVNRPGPGLALHSSMPTEDWNDGGVIDFVDLYDYTVSFWAQGEGMVYNMSQRYGWGEEYFAVANAGTAAVKCTLRIAGQYLDVSANLSAGRFDEWIHYTITRKGTRITVYVNGKEITSKDFMTSSHYQQIKFMDPPYWFPNSNISVDEFTVWNVALDEETIRDWMCKKITSEHPYECENLVLYFNFEEGQGTVVEDKRGGSDLILVPGLTYVPSGAAVGDESVHDYQTPNDITFTHPDGDYIEAVKSNSDLIDGVHLYRVNNTIPDPSEVEGSSINSMDSSRYWGIYIADRNLSAILEFDVIYHFENNRMINPGNEDELRLLSRLDRTETPWNDNIGVTPNLVDNTLTLTGQARGEYVLGGTTTNTFIGDCSPATPVFITETGATNQSAICGNATGLVYRVEPDPMVETYIWTLPNGLSGFSSSDSININAELGYESPPDFTISVIGVNGCGQSSSATYDVTINPSPTLADAGPDQLILPPLTSATMDGNTVSGGETGTWRPGSVGNGTISDPNDPLTSITSIQTGINYFVWEIDNGNCPPSTDTVKITVGPPPVGIIDPVSGEMPIELCSDNIFTLEVIPPEDITPDSYVWNLPDGMSIVGQTGTQVQIQVVTGLGGEIEVSAVYSVVASDPFVSDIVAIRTTPVKPVFVISHDTICLKTTNTYQALSHPSIDRYEWTFPDGVYHTVYPEPFVFEVDLLFEQMIEGYVKVQAFNGTCTSENAKDSAHFVVMEAPPAPTIPDMYQHTQEWQTYILCKPDTSIMWVVNDMPGATYNWTYPESVLATPMNDNNSAMIIDADDIYNGNIYVTRTIGEGVCNTSAPVSMRFIASDESADVEATSIAMISAGDPMDLQVSMTYEFEAYGGVDYYWMLPEGVTRIDTLGWANETDATISLYVEQEFTGYLEVWALYRGGCVRNKKRIALCSNSMGNCLLPPDFISGTTEFCQGGNLNVTVSNIAAADEYVWTLPDGTEIITLTNTIDQQIIDPMIGTVEVYVRNAFGESTPGGFYIRVMPVVMDPIEFVDEFGNPVNEREICEGNSYNPIFVKDVGASDYTWDITSGIIMWNPEDPANGYRLDPKTSGTDTSILVKYVDWWANANPNPGYVTVRASSACGTPVEDSIYYFLATPANIAVPHFVDMPTSVCVGSKVTYRVEPIERADQYFWSVPSGLVASVLITDVPELTVDVTPGVGGVVTVYATVLTCGGGTTLTQETDPISIIGEPVDFDFIEAPLAGCPGNTLTYSVNDIGATDYTWDIPAGLSPIISNAVIQIDNNDPECEISDNWNTVTESSYVNGDYIIQAEADNFDNYVIYRPDIIVEGIYKVYWSFHTSSIGSDMYLDVQASDDLYSTRVKQEYDFGKEGTWLHIGDYHFEPGTYGYVRVNTYNSSWRMVNTDAVRFELSEEFTIADTLLNVNVIGDGDGALCVTVENEMCESGYTVCTDPINLGGTLELPVITLQENSVCEGLDYDFSVSDIGADTYTWILPAGMSIGGQTGTVTGLTREETVTMDLNTGSPVQIGVSGVINSCSVIGDTVYTSDIDFTGSGCQLPDPVFITTADTTCPGLDLVFSVLPVTDAEQYQWVLPIGVQQSVTGTTGIVTTTIPTITVTTTNSGELGVISVTALAPLAGISSSNQISTVNLIVVVSVPDFNVSTIDLSSCTSTDGLITLSGLNTFTSYSLTYSYEGTPQGPFTFTTDATGVYNFADMAGGEYTQFVISMGACSNTNPGTYNINATIPVVSLGFLPSLCENDTAHTLLGGMPLGGTYSGVGVSLGKFDPTVAGEGTHVITYEYSEGPGCTNSVESSITVNPLPSGSLQTDDSDDIICIGAAVTYTASDADSFVFTLNGLEIENNTTGIYINPNPVDGDIIGVEATLNSCATNYAETTISVVPLPSGSLSSTHDTICEGVEVSFTASGGDTYNFLINDVIVTSTTPNTLVLATLNNGDVVTSEIIDVNGCSAMADDTIVMEITPAPNTSILGETDLCPGVMGMPYEASDLQNVLYEWTVTGDDNYVETDCRSLEIDWGTGSEGIINLSLTDTTTGCSSVSSLSITLYDAGAPTIIDCPNGFEVEAEIENGVWHYLIKEEDVIIPAVQEDCESTGYTLSFSINGNLPEDQENFVGTEILDGENEIVWTAKDFTNNESEECVVEISMIVNERVPSAFSPNGDGFNDTWEMPFLQMYDDCIVKVYNRQGKIVFESDRGYTQPWDGSSFGKRLAVDSYHYIIISNDDKNPKKGTITIIR